MPKSPDSHVWYDGLFDFSMGMDSGVQPLLLKRNQAAFITNGTVRQTFIRQRPTYNKLTINYGGNTTLQNQFEQNLFQGACFYNPDTGNQCLMASVAGQLFQFSISGSTLTASNVSIPGSPQSTTATQAWLWQAENYVIWNDGINLPVFYNGTSSKRSNGAQTLVGTTAADFTAPAVGATVPVTFTGNYTGPFNVPIWIPATGAVYMATGTAVTYNAILTNISDTAGTTIITGKQVVFSPSTFGVLALSQAFPQGSFTVQPYPPGTFSVNVLLTLPYTGSIGDRFNLLGATWQVTGISGATVSVVNTTTFNFATAPAGTVLPSATNTMPNVVVGTVETNFVVPAVGSTVTAILDSPFQGTAGQIVYIGTGQYTIAVGPPNPPPPVSATVTMQNLSDTPGTNNAHPIQFFTIPQLPAGRMGAYGMGRNWMSLTDGKSFIASDIVGGSAGTPALNNRDAVLDITENTFLAGGGVFQIPGSMGDIRAMIFTSVLDTSMGQGPLQVLTPTNIFSCQAPVDRTTWQKLTNPILTNSLIANGGMGQNSTIAVNGDTMFRAVDGIRSLILGQRQFSTWGNVPLSLEMDRVINLDNLSLLPYSSAVVFDNRVIFTASPQAGPLGVYHQGAIVLNLDPIRSIDEKTQPTYDGEWEDLNVLQYVSGVVNGVQRLFAFNYNATTTNRIEIYEVLTDGGGQFDNGTTPVTWSFETASLFKDIKQKGLLDLIRLEDGEIYVDEVIGTVNFWVYYKPDQFPCWTKWYAWSITGPPGFPANQEPADCTLKPQFRTRMGLGKPSASDCDADTGFPMREGSTFQFKFVIQGHCRFLGAKFTAVSLPDIYFAKPVCPGIDFP